MKTKTSGPGIRFFPSDNEHSSCRENRITRSVLLVESNPHLAIILHSLLRDEGFHPVLAMDAAKALRDAKSGPFRFVVVDLDHPKGDYLGLLDSLRQALPQTPILVTSAQSGPCQEAFHRGAAGYLLKPFRLDALQSTFTQMGSDEGGSYWSSDSSIRFTGDS